MAYHSGHGIRQACLTALLAVGLASCGSSQVEQAFPGDSTKDDKHSLNSGFPAMTIDDVVQANALYIRYCAMCHDKPQGQAPSRQALGGLSAQRIYDALASGPMQAAAASLSEPEKRVLAASLPAGEPLPEPALDANMCAAAEPLVAPAIGEWSAWSPDPGNTRYQPAGGLDVRSVSKLKLKWVFAYPGSVAGLPLVVGNRIVTAGASGVVVSLDARTGCTYWTAKMSAEVRGAPLVAPIGNNGKRAAIVADAAGLVVAFDLSSGKRLWEHRAFIDRIHRITGSPVHYNGRIYVPIAGFDAQNASNADYECCKGRGGVVALEVASGKLLWKQDAIAEPLRKAGTNSRGTQMFGPAGASIWSAPTVDAKRGVLYVTTGNAFTYPAPRESDAIIAFDLITGTRKWVSQAIAGDAFVAGCHGRDLHPNCPKVVGPDADLGMPAVLADLQDGRQLLLAASKNGMVFAFDPDRSGRIVWKTRVATGNATGSLILGAAVEGGRVYLPVSYNKPEGGVVALDIATGKVAWRAAPEKPVCSWGGAACSSAQRSPPTSVPGAVFAGSNDGVIRAYDTRSGAVIWRFDTGKPRKAANGVIATGGPMGRGGQTVAGGMLYVNAGAGYGRPGNALLAFSLDGK